MLWGCQLSDTSLLAAFKLAEAPPAWTESFESYAAGTFPSTWTPNANATDISTNFVDGSIATDGSKSLKLFGQDFPSASWAALTYHPLNVTPPFEIMIDVRNGSEAMLGTEPFRASVALRQGTSWANPSRTFIAFTQGGSIENTSASTLASYVPGAWYSLDILYERPTSSSVRVTCTINGVPYGSATVAATPSESTLTNLDLDVGQGSAWFDNIRVYQR